MVTKLKLIHCNDTHSYVQNFGKKDALISDLKNQCDSSTIPLLLDAGDLLSGSIFYTLFEGDAEIELINELNYDYVGIGNHDFDRGVDAIKKYIEHGKFDLYCANIKFIDKYEYFNQHIKPYDIRVLPSGESVLIFSLLTLETTQTALCNDVMKISDPLTTLENLLTTIPDITDYVILLSHLGYEMDTKIASMYSQVNLIIGGHSHTKLDTPVNINNTIIVQAGMYGKYLGELVVDLDNNIEYYKLHEVENYPKSDKNIQALIDKFQMQIDEQVGEIVGHSSVDLPYSREFIYQQDQPIGNLIADAYFSQAVSDHHYVNGAIINGHGIRSSLNKGDIRIKDLMNILPFNKSLCIVEMTGYDLLQSLKNGISPQVSHLKMTYENNSLSKVYVYKNGSYKTLDVDDTYYIVTNDFVALGKDKYIGFSSDKIKVNNLGTDYQVVAEYIKKSNINFHTLKDNRIKKI